MGVSMGKRLAPIIAMILMVVPMASFALGLGPITMRSGLNQPLLAEIEIHSLQPGDLDGLAVNLASSDDFKRMDMERLKFLTKIKFSVDYRADGSAYIRLVTKKAIIEPFIELLVEAKWPRGRALKNYTVLVDPPVLTAEAPAPVQQASTAPVFTPPNQRQQRQRQTKRPSSARRNKPITDLEIPKSVSKRRQQQVSSARTPAEDFSTADGSLNYGRVKRGDTLSNIAQKMRRSADISVTTQQMMLALLKSNPGAFVNDNINQLKAGHVLRIEDSSILDSLTQSEAVREVRRQTQQWNSSNGRGRLVRQADASEFADDEGSSSSARMSPREARDAEAQLKLVAPGREGLGVSGAGDDSESGQQLQEELLLANAALDANKASTDELKGRISDLEEQLTSMQRLIMIKDEEMLGLQNNLDKGVDTIPEAMPELDNAQQLAAEEPAKPVAAAEEDEGFLSDTLMLMLAVLLVIGMVVGLVIRRRKMQQGFEESILNVGMSASVGASAAAMSTPMSQPQESGIVSDFAMSDMGGIQSDTTEVDPISEADVYLAYGRHQQAQDILEQAIASDPERLELHTKLLEVYHGAGNKEAFDNHAKIVHEKVGGDESNEHWARAVSLGSEISPENPLFGGGGIAVDDNTIIQPPIGGVGVTADEEALLDFEFEENSDPTVMFPAQQPAGGSSVEMEIDDDSLLDFDVDSLDFNLDEEMPDDALASLDEIDNFDTEITKSADNSGLEFEIPLETLSEDNVAVAQGADDLNFSLDSFDDIAEPESGSLDEDSGLSFVDDSSENAFNLSLVDEEELPEEDQPGLEAFENSGGDGLDDDIFANVDEIGTKLDLAKAYVDMGDSDGARSILDEVIEEGDDTQKQQAEDLLQQMG